MGNLMPPTPNRLTPKISLYSDCKTAEVYMGIDPNGRFILYADWKEKVMGDYLEGYLAALDDVLTEIAVENPDSVNAVRYLIRHMANDCTSE